MPIFHQHPPSACRRINPRGDTLNVATELKGCWNRSLNILWKISYLHPTLSFITYPSTQRSLWTIDLEFVVPARRKSDGNRSFAEIRLSHGKTCRSTAFNLKEKEKTGKNWKNSPLNGSRLYQKEQITERCSGFGRTPQSAYTPPSWPTLWLARLLFSAEVRGRCSLLCRYLLWVGAHVGWVLSVFCCWIV